MNPAQMYRHYDKEGNLLYVGISSNHLQRLTTHKQISGWFKLIARIEIQHFKTREEARWAEHIAIKTEFPIFNKQQNDGTPPKSAIEKLKQADRTLARRERAMAKLR